MKDIFKSQLFQLKKERLPYVVFVLCILLLCIVIVNEDGRASFGEMMCGLTNIISQISLMFLFTAVAVVCGKDFPDKTGNYEIMGGHTRFEVYMGRALLAIVVGVLGTLLLFFFVIGIGCAFVGWGDAVSLKGILFRVLLLMFPLFRIACEIVFLVFILRSAYLVLTIGYIYLFFILELMMGVSKAPTSYYLGMTNIFRILDMTFFQVYSPVNPGVKMVVYDTTLKLSDVWGTVVVSVGVGLLFLWLGYHFFKSDDIH